MQLIKRINSSQNKALYRCSCGNVFVTYFFNVQNGHTKSCGCLTRSKNKSKSRTYDAWRNMKSRATYADYYPHHAGRGIGMDASWRDYYRFVADMGECPPGLSLDRIDGDKGYEPGNCRWADQNTQMNNTTRNHRVVYGGVSRTISEWSQAIGIKASTIIYRLRRGWPAEQALTLPKQRGVKLNA